ncbi:MAG TPA: cysteine--tRNA ligase [Mesorhizobium sp.]|jgi:cysteinyl-tRNA synthetase|nr:cysteine--tRNA ligase [Mesorhizobium sp.]
MSDTVPTLHLYNTLAREKQAFVPIDPQNVRMYVCGPTVYDFAHIGNARPAIVFDVLFRLLRHLHGPERVTYVRNITDVDDKINARAARDFPGLALNEAIRRVTETTARQYREDMRALGCLDPTVEPRATDFVLPRPDGKADMASLIQALIDRGHAYAVEGEILFDVSSMPDYGALSRRPLDQQQAGARVAVEAHKRNPADFVLWKGSTEQEPGWDAVFRVEGRELAIRGRPGWHIECSAMSAAHLGEVFDIHGGGLDLIFPHHENEIAQSRCAHGTPVMANTWMHNGFLQVEGRKMSKSEGNFFTVAELLHEEKFGGRKWPGEVLRLAMLMTHYREPIDFSVRRLEEAERTLSDWKYAMWYAGLSWENDNETYCEAMSPSDVVVEALCNDLNFSEALPELHRLSKSRNIFDGHTVFASLKWLGLVNYEDMRRWESYQESAIVTLASNLNVGSLREIIDRRLAYIREKNWIEADRIRDELLAQGIQLKDGKDPATGERVTTWEVKT